MEKFINILLIGFLFVLYALNEFGRANFESSMCTRFTKFFASPTGFLISTGIAIGMLLATWFWEITDAHRLQHFALILLWVWPAAFIAVFIRHRYGHRMTYWVGDSLSRPWHSAVSVGGGDIYPDRNSHVLPVYLACILLECKSSIAQTYKRMCAPEFRSTHAWRENLLHKNK